MTANKYPWPMVTTPDGEEWPIATVALECPYEGCAWKHIFRATAMKERIPAGKTTSRYLIKHINDEHAAIYDVLGLNDG